MIEFLNVSKSFGDRLVLDGVSISVDKGKVLYIVGTSGAGKSVLVKQLVGLLRPDSGQILLDGQDVTRLPERGLRDVRRRCAMVLQHSTLFDSMTVLDNVALPLRKHRGLKRAAARRAAVPFLELVHMADARHHLPAELGDGLRKRVAIARALTLEPEYMIFDEPTTGLDPAAAANVDRLLQRLRNDTGVTAVVVSHDLRSIFTVADRVALLYQGRIRLDGTPDDFRQSTDPVVQQFIQGLPDGPMRV